MLRNSSEIHPECKQCFNVAELIAQLAELQNEFANLAKKNYEFDNSGKHIVYTGQLCVARQSDVGRQYTELEDRLLDVLELGSFCVGVVCFKDKMPETLSMDENPIVTHYEAPSPPPRAAIFGYRWMNGLL